MYEILMGYRGICGPLAPMRWLPVLRSESNYIYRSNGSHGRRPSG